MKLDQMVGDDISINSSASQEHHHQHHHHHHESSLHHTPIHAHNLQHHGPGLGFKNSFVSVAHSLPPDLDHHYSNHHSLRTPPNHTSIEDISKRKNLVFAFKFLIISQKVQFLLYFS